MYQEVQLKEVIILYKVRSTVKLFSEKDKRCVYEFIKQVNRLKALMETEAYTVLTQELLSREVRQAMPHYVKTTQQVYRFLLDKFGGIEKTLDKWLSLLEQTAQTRHRGNRTRLERFTAIAPTVSMNQLGSLVSHLQMMNRILMTLQTQDADLFRSSLPGESLSLSGRRGTESLDALRSFLDESIRTLMDNGPPFPLFYHYDGYLVDLPDKDPEHHFYGTQQPRVCAEEDDYWWEPEISYPCGLPGQVSFLPGILVYVEYG